MNKNHWLYLSFIFCAVLLQAQDTIPYSEYREKNTPRTLTQEKDTFKVIDTTKVISTSIKDDVKTSTFTTTTIKDSVVYICLLYTSPSPRDS